MSTQEEEISHLEDQSSQRLRRKYKCRYQARCFSSKGAFLILLWTLFVSTAHWALDINYLYFLPTFRGDSFLPVLYILPHLPWVLSALLSGYLADAHYGNYRVTRAGIFLFFLAVILFCVIKLAVNHNDYNLLYTILITITQCLNYAFRATVLVTSLQLGLEQMPEASSARITSYLYWFVLSMHAGIWISGSLFHIPLSCIGLSSTDTSYDQIWSLFPVVCTCLVLCSHFLLSPKWLIVEPKSPQSLKIIFRVFKFAKKHKAPVNRSALTYWEEDIPSRIDLGKSKYGGPFTTEQVEDVKTVVRILAISVPFWIVFSSYYLFNLTYLVENVSTPMHLDFSSNCTSVLSSHFMYNTSWWVVIGTLIYEFFIYPLASQRIPTTLKRIGAASFLTIAMNVAYLILVVISYTHGINTPIEWFSKFRTVTSAVLTIMLLTSALEFVCAQSPHNMKGSLIGYVLCIFSFSLTIVDTFTNVFRIYCNHSYCSIVYCSLATLLSVVGFVTHCLLAHWYKRRVRDDIINPHWWAEEFYGRYLSE